MTVDEGGNDTRPLKMYTRKCRWLTVDPEATHRESNKDISTLKETHDEGFNLISKLGWKVHQTWTL